MDDMKEKLDLDQDNNVDKKNQMSLEQRMIQSDAKRHRSFFSSLKSKSNFGSVLGMVGVVFILAVAVGAGLALRGDDVAPEDTSASSECGDFQVKVYDEDGYTCKDCGAGEYGRLDLCETDSPSGICEQADSGCFKPSL